MKILTVIIKVLLCLFIGLFFFFMLKTGSATKSDSFRYPDSNVSENNKQAIVETLRVLQEGYDLRDIAKIDECIAKTVDTTSIFILGTNPDEIFKGKDGAQRLLFGDWSYWGKVKYDIDRLFVDQITDSIVYVVFPGNITIDIWNMNFPLQVSGVMMQRGNGKWVFSKMQFQYAWNTNNIIFARIAAFGTLILLILLLIIYIIKWSLNRFYVTK